MTFEKQEVDSLIALVIMAMVDRFRFPDYARLGSGRDDFAQRFVKSDEMLQMCEQEKTLNRTLAKLYVLRSAMGE